MKFIPRYIQEISIFSFLKLFFTKKIKFPENYLFFESAKSSIKWLLGEYKKQLKTSLKVGIPCYSCFSVYQSVIESENEVIILDINPLCFLLSEKNKNKIVYLDILIWINYFGFKYKVILEEIRKINPNLIIIEDCSHLDLRDYINSNNNINSNFAIFSFNFRKQIAAGSGGLIVKNNIENNKTTNINLDIKNIEIDKLNFSRILHILVYNFSYSAIIYKLLKNKIQNKRNQGTQEFSEIEIKLINPFIKKLFFVQYKTFRIKKMLGKCTKNYFSGKNELIKDYVFGQLYYYPVKISQIKNINNIENIDKFMLWENLILNYKEFNILITAELFPNTFEFFNNFVFLPVKYFENLNSEETFIEFK